MDTTMYAAVNDEWKLDNNNQFSFDRLGFYKNNELCWCSACYGYFKNPSSFLYFSLYYISDPDMHYGTRNYVNLHCIECVCKWCVCDARFALKLFSRESIPASRIVNNCPCGVCEDTDEEGEYRIMRRADYSELLESGAKKYSELLDYVKQDLRDVLNRDVAIIVFDYFRPTSLEILEWVHENFT